MQKLDSASGEERLCSERSLRILVVGGFSRAALAFCGRALADPALNVTMMVRNSGDASACEAIVEVSDYFDPSDDILRGNDTLVNFTGLTGSQSEQLLFEVNARGPVHLAAKAKHAGIPHFVQLSSLHVYGYAEDISYETREAPVSAYGRAKQVADEMLLSLADENFKVTVLRLPILYGGGAGDSFRKLAFWMSKLPFFPIGLRPNPRSALHVDNLACVLTTVIRQRPAGIRFAADPQPFTLDVLAGAIDASRGGKTRLVRLPNIMFLPLRFLAKGLYSRLFRPNLVRAGICLVPDEPFPVALQDGLKEILPR